MQGEKVGIEEPGIGQLVTQLAVDAREMAKAELALVKTRATVSVTRYKNAAIFFAIAGVLGFAALIALLVGLIMTVASLVGPGWATLIVIGTTMVLVAILGLVGKAQLKQKVTS